jgi:hypothetical protein
MGNLRARSHENHIQVLGRIDKGAWIIKPSPRAARPRQNGQFSLKDLTGNAKEIRAIAIHWAASLKGDLRELHYASILAN